MQKRDQNIEQRLAMIAEMMLSHKNLTSMA